MLENTCNFNMMDLKIRNILKNIIIHMHLKECMQFTMNTDTTENTKIEVNNTFRDNAYNMYYGPGRQCTQQL